MQPRQIRDTSKPVRPSFTNSIIRSPTNHRPKGSCDVTTRADSDSLAEQEGFEPSVPPYFLKKRDCLLREAMSPSPRCNPAGAPADEELEAAWASHRRGETHWRRGAGFEPPVPSGAVVGVATATPPRRHVASPIANTAAPL